MTVYVDSSVVLRWLLKQPGRIARWNDWDHVVTSELMRVEVLRTLDRLRIRGKLLDRDMARLVTLLGAVTNGFEQVRIVQAVLERAASPMPTTLGTLDSIHLATALLWVEYKSNPLMLLTHDMELAIAAQASGLEVGPEPAG